MMEIANVLRKIQINLTLLEVRQDQARKAKTQVNTIHSNLSSSSGMSDAMGEIAFKSMQIIIPRYASGNPKTWIIKIKQY